MDLRRFDPFQVFEVSHLPCTILHIKVLRGYNITKGYIKDKLDVPDPYVTLTIKTAPNCHQRTTYKQDDVNPEWNEEFIFYVDPQKDNRLVVDLWDANYIKDEWLGSVMIILENIPIQESQRQIHQLEFNKKSMVDIAIWAQESTQPDLRFSLTLCEEEIEFIERRKRVIFKSMQEILGEGSPKSSREVPVIGILGSGGGFRAMTAFSGVFSALADSKILDMCMYAAGLSGSSWYLSQLYSHPDWPNKSPSQLQSELRSNIDSSPFYLLGPQSMYSYITRIIEKRHRGQPVSFTDLFGHLVGETLLPNRQDARLTDQQLLLQKGITPLPLYTCLHVKKSVSAMVFHEWIEFSPYEIGLPKYGTFMKSELFGSKFFMGHLIRRFPESPLHFLMGVWGSAFCIQFKRLLKDDKQVDECVVEEEWRQEFVQELISEMDEQMDESSDSELDDFGPDSNNKRPGKGNLHNNNNVSNHPNGNRHKDKTLPKTKEVPKEADKGFWQGLLQKAFDKTGDFLLGSIEGRAAQVHSFMRGLSLYKVYPFSPFTSFEENGHVEPVQFEGIFQMYPTNMKKLYVVDGGLTFNSPYPLLLRPQRQVDIILSFDFSARQSDSTPPFKEIKLAEKWARLNNVPFPEVDVRRFDREGMKECYVFENPKDPKCPVILHFVLANITFRQEKKPGIPRTTEEEKDFADFDIFDDPKHPYSTFNFTYSHQAFDRLTQLTEFNTLMFKDLIIQKIKECVQRKQAHPSRRIINLRDIKRLRLQRHSEEKLKLFLKSQKTESDIEEESSHSHGSENES